MNSSNSPKSTSSRYPNLGKLTVAILERVVEPILGKDAIKIIGTPYANRQLFNKLRDALVKAEKEFILQNPDSRISEGLIQLSIADLSSIQKAFWNFVENPASPDFPRVLYKQLCVDFPNVPDTEKISAVEKYLRIIKAEIVNIDDEVRKNVSSAALLSIDKHAASIDTKLDKLDLIHQELAKIYELFAKFNVPFVNSDGGGRLVSENEKKPKDSGVAGHPFAQRIDFDLDKTLEGLTLPEIGNLREIIEKWIPPLIEPYIDVDEYDRPYGRICESIVETLVFTVSSKIRSSSASMLTILSATDGHEREFERFKTINSVFKSNLPASLPGYKSKNSVYLESLSELFPHQDEQISPLGYYLLDLNGPRADGRLENLVERAIHRNHYFFDMDLTRFQLLYISGHQLSERDSLSKIEDNKHYSPDWKNKVNLVTRTVTGKRPKYYYHIVFFDEKSFRYVPLDIDEIGYMTRYRLDISLQEFARFVTGFAEDFLSLASRAIVFEREAREYNQIIINGLKNKKS